MGRPLTSPTKACSEEPLARPSMFRKVLAERAARRSQGVRKINDLDAERDELAFELTSLFGAPPITLLEHNVEVEVLPKLDLIVSHGWDGHIDEADAAEDLQSFNKGNDERNPLCLISTSSATTPTMRKIAMTLGAPQEVEMADVEKIEGARTAADADHRSRIPPFVIEHEKTYGVGDCETLRFLLRNWILIRPSDRKSFPKAMRPARLCCGPHCDATQKPTSV